MEKVNGLTNFNTIYLETYDYVIYVNGSKYAEANSHQELIEYIEQIRVERGEGAKYTITLHKI